MLNMVLGQIGNICQIQMIGVELLRVVNIEKCALFSLLAIVFKIFENHNNYLICLRILKMGTQFMNSFLYMFITSA